MGRSSANSYPDVETFTIEVTATATPATIRSDGSSPEPVTHRRLTLEARLLGVRG